jgi:hypothetical protein
LPYSFSDSLPHSSRSLFFLSPSISLSSISLPSSLHISPRSLLSFSLISPHVFYRRTVLASPPAPSLFSFRPIPVLSLLVPTSESRHHFSLSHTLSPLPIVLRFFYSLSSLLLIRVFVPLPFYSPSPCTFARRVVFFFSPSSRNFSSVSPLSLIPSKPLPVYLYFPVSYFHPFSSISLFSGQLS